jgi:hypothetical protein
MPASENLHKKRHGFLLDHLVGGCEKGACGTALKL